VIPAISFNLIGDGFPLPAAFRQTIGMNPYQVI